MNDIFTSRPRRLEWAGLALIIIVAAVLRFGAPDVVVFRRDQAMVSQFAADMLQGRYLPLLSIDSSIGLQNPPIAVYMMLPPYLLSRDPVLATAYIALLNVIAVLFAYVLVRRYYGPVGAFAAGMLYAASPWAVIYSRSIWPPDMLFVLILPALLCGLAGFVEGKRWGQLLHLPLMGLIGQIHYGTFVLIPITLYLIFVGRKKLTRAFLISIVLTVLVFVPFAVGAIQANIFSAYNFHLSLSQGSTRTGGLTLAPDMLRNVIDVTTGTGVELLAGIPQSQSQLAALVSGVYPPLYLLLVVTVLAAGWLIVRVVRIRDRRTPMDITLLLWLLVTLIVFTPTWTPVWPHYVAPMIPAPFVVIGAASADLWRGLSRRIAVRRVVFVVGAVALALIVILQGWLQGTLLQFVATHDTDSTAQMSFGPPLSDLMPARNAILAQHPQSVLGNLDGQYIGFHDQATIWNFLLYDVPLVRFLDDTLEVYPATPSLYLSRTCTAQSFHTLSAPGCYTITTRTAADFDKLNFTHIPDADKTIFANGARIIAYQWQPAQSDCISVAWQTNGPRPEDYNFAVHFINAKGDEIVNADSIGWRGRYWRQGDIVVKRFCPSVDQRAQITGVHLGMYTYQDTAEGRKFYGVDLLGANGAAVGQWVEVKFP